MLLTSIVGASLDFRTSRRCLGRESGRFPLLELMTAFLFDVTAGRGLGGGSLNSTMGFEEDLLVDPLVVVNLCDGIVVGEMGYGFVVVGEECPKE